MIIEPKTEADFLDIFDLVKELRPDLDKNQYLAFLKASISRGYRALVYQENNTSIGFAGFVISANFALGKKMYVEDLVTSENYRSRGIGTKLITCLEELAKNEGCQAIHLDSGVQRHRAHKFYLTNNYKILAHHFVKIF